MTAVQWLRRAWAIDDEIRELEESTAEAYRRVTQATPQLSGEGSASSPDPHKFDAYVEYALALAQRERRLLTTKAEISRAVSGVEDAKCRRLLHLRFVDCCTWPKVQEEMRYSETQCKRIYRKALREITPVIEKMALNGPLDR